MGIGSLQKPALAALTCVSIAAAVAACGSSSNSNNSNSSGGSGSAAKTDIAWATDQLSKFTSEPTWKAPGPPFDAKKTAGKTVYDTPTLSANAFLQAITNAQGAAAKLANVKYVVCANSGTASAWAQCLKEGIAQKPNVLLMGGADPAEVRPEITEANRANLPVVSGAYYDPRMPRVPGIAAWSFDPYEQGAHLMAAWAIKQTNAKANVLIVTSKELAPSNYMTRTITDDLQSHCAGCKSTEINVPLVNWATQMQGAVSSALLANPSINYVIPIYDPMLSFVVAGVRAAGRAGKVGITSYNGTPAGLKMVADGTVSMIVGQDLNCVGYSDLDPVLRILAGQKPVNNLNHGLRVWDASNIKDAGSPPNPLAQGYGNACTGGFKKLWGLG